MRFLATLFVLLALVAQCAASGAAMAHEPGDAAASIVSCKMHAAHADDANDRAPAHGVVHDHSNCVLCQINDLTTLPAAEAFLAELRTEAERIAPQRSSPTTHVFRFNFAAPTRGPPAFA